MSTKDHTISRSTPQIAGRKPIDFITIHILTILDLQIDPSPSVNLSGIACIVRFGCDLDTDSNRATPTAREISKTQTLRNKGPCLSPLLLVGS